MEFGVSRASTQGDAFRAIKVMRRPGGLDNKPHYRLYLIFLLATILAFNGLDSTALGLALSDVKGALHLTDSELGFLTGIAFSLFYSTAGIPIGRWADRGDRVAIIAVTTALWGMMVMLVGATRSFAELLMARVGVAVGEAGCIPAAYSLIGDHFAREERPRALATYLIGSSFSVILGYPLAGWLSYHYGWRLMFVCIGMLSMVIAPVAWWTLSEPRRAEHQLRRGSRPGDESPAIPQVLRVLWRNRTFRYLLASLCVSSIFGSGLAVWQPSFFVRSYGLSAERLGLYFSFAYGMATIIGMYGGGYLACRYAPKNERLQLRIVAFFGAGYGLISALIYLSEDPYVSVALLALAMISAAAGTGPVFAAIQAVIPERMRAISISIIYLFTNLVGGGIGPLLVGAMSDALHPYLGAESLRYALLAMCPGNLIGCWLLWMAARTVVADTAVAFTHSSSSYEANCVHT